MLTLSPGEQRSAVAGADVAGDGQRRFRRVGLGGVDAAAAAGAAVAADGHGGGEQRRHSGQDGTALQRL